MPLYAVQDIHRGTLLGEYPSYREAEARSRREGPDFVVVTIPSEAWSRHILGAPVFDISRTLESDQVPALEDATDEARLLRPATIYDFLIE